MEKENSSKGGFGATLAIAGVIVVVVLALVVLAFTMSVGIEVF
jgi:hypothetical protein